MGDKVRLTDKRIAGLKPRDAEFTVWDDALPGLGVRVRPSGAMAFVLVYRRGQGRKAPVRKLTLGPVAPDFGVDAARAAAKAALAKVLVGQSPADDKTSRRTGLTVAELASKWMAEHVGPKRAKNTADGYQRLFDTHILPSLGIVPAASLTRADVQKLHAQVAEQSKGRGKARTKGGPYIANRMLAQLSAMFAWAMKLDLIPYVPNPARLIERYKEQPRERFLSDAELARLGEALRLAEGPGLPWPEPTSKHAPKLNRVTIFEPHSVNAVRLLLFTGCRLREILHARWADLDRDRGVLRLPTSKVGARQVVLNSAALAVLDDLAKVRLGALVIPGGRDPDVPRADLKRIWSAVTTHAGITGLRIHDLRHQFASTGVQHNLSLSQVGGLLGHTTPATTMRYSHHAVDNLRRSSDLIGDRLSSALKGGC